MTGFADALSILAGPIVGGFVFASRGWRWTQWMTLILALAALLLGVGLPETYQREIMRRRAKRRGKGPLKLAPAGSGETLGEMAKLTFFTPLKSLVSEPHVGGISI